MTAQPDPLLAEALKTFADLLAEAERAGEPEPTAMNLATVSADQRVHSRIVLLKGVDVRGFRFFTNYQSAKGEQLAAHPQAALCVHWKRLREQVQVRVEGTVGKLSADESDAYFASRARGSQIGAWASLQSQDLPDRAAFEARVAAVEQRFAGVKVTRPPHWGGYLLSPAMIEFWYGAGFRLHERMRYRSDAGRWSKGLLYP
ncbi:MAG: pyridoxamine 5'-phosphate oxidase [Dokdonella sp.]